MMKFFFKIISCHAFSEPRAQAEMNDYGEYDKVTRTSRNDNDDNNFFKKYQVSYIFKTTSSI